MSINYGTGLNAPWLTRKEDKAKTVISKWLDLSNYQVYCSVSGGKDSLVASHLIRQVYQDCPLIWVNQGHLAEWPDCVKLLYYLRDLGWNIFELCPPLGLIQLFKKYGMSFDGKFTSLDQKHCQELLIKPIEEWSENNNIKGYAWGLRKESRGRKEFIKSKGELTQLKNGQYLCTPLAYWSTEDVWLYIDKYELPYAAIYDVEGRDTFRNGPPIDTALANWGKLATLKVKYPNIWQEIVAIFPEYANHV